MQTQEFEIQMQSLLQQQSAANSHANINHIVQAIVSLHWTAIVNIQHATGQVGNWCKNKLELPVAEPSVELTATCRSEPPKVEAKLAHSITTPSLSE